MKIPKKCSEAQWFVLPLLLLVLTGCTPRMVVDPGVLPEPARPLSANEMYRQAQDLESRQMIGEARETYIRFLDLYNADTRVGMVLYRLGQIEVQLGNLESAKGYLQQVAERFPATALAVEALLLLGDSQLALDAADQAAAAYIDAIGHDTSADRRQDLIERLHAALWEVGDNQRSALVSRLADRLVPAGLVFDLAQKEIAAKRYELAVELLELFVVKDPMHAHAAEARVLIEGFQAQTRYRRHTIGCLLPLSGALEMWGIKALQGIELALMLSQSKASTPLTLLIKDTNSSPEGAGQAAVELAAEGVAAIIGPLATVDSAAPVAETYGIPMIVLTQQTSDAFGRDFVFRNFITPRLQVETLVVYAVERLGLQRFAMLYPRDTYGETYYRLFTEEVSRHGGRILFAEAYEREVVDFSNLVERLARHYVPPPEHTPRADLKASRPASADSLSLKGIEAVFIPDGPAKAALIIPQLAFHDIRPIQLLGTNLWHSQKFLNDMSSYLEQAIFTVGFFAGTPDAAVQDFVRQYQQNYGEPPGFIEAVAYDSARLLFDIMQRPEVRFRTSIRHALLDKDGYFGVTGRTRWFDNGDMHKDLLLMQMQRKQVRVINDPVFYRRSLP